MYTHIQNLQLGGVFLPKGLVTCELICIISHLPKISLSKVFVVGHVFWHASFLVQR